MIFQLSDKLPVFAFIAELEKRLSDSLLFSVFTLNSNRFFVLNKFQLQIPADFTQFTHGNGVHVTRQLDLIVAYSDFSAIINEAGTALSHRIFT
jgi:hypothetical protein